MVVGIAWISVRRLWKASSPLTRVIPSYPASSSRALALPSLPWASVHTVISCTLSGRAFSKAAKSGISAMQGEQKVPQKLIAVRSFAAMSFSVKLPPSRVWAVKACAASPAEQPAASRAIASSMGKRRMTSFLNGMVFPLFIKS